MGSRPERLGPYELGERLGAGGMGAVFRAVHIELGAARAEPGAAHPAGREAEQPLADLESASVVVGEGVEPHRDADLHAGHEGPRGEGARAERSNEETRNGGSAHAWLNG